VFQNVYPLVVRGEIFPIDPLAVDLISKLVVFNPAERWTAEQALHHPYFKDLAV
jgi:serine/threonine protein kinase